MREKKNKKMVIVVQESLHYEFANTCEFQYKTASEVIRSFMLQYIKEHKNADPQQRKASKEQIDARRVSKKMQKKI